MSNMDINIKAFRFGLICLRLVCVCFHWTYDIWEMKAVVKPVLRIGFKILGDEKKRGI